MSSELRYLCMTKMLVYYRPRKSCVFVPDCWLAVGGLCEKLWMNFVEIFGNGISFGDKKQYTRSWVDPYPNSEIFVLL